MGTKSRSLRGRRASLGVCQSVPLVSMSLSFNPRTPQGGRFLCHSYPVLLQTGHSEAQWQEVGARCAPELGPRMGSPAGWFAVRS